MLLLISFIAVATYGFHRLIMRKVKLGLYCYLTAGILTELFYECLLSSPPPSIKKLYKFLILICCHGNWNLLNLAFIAVHSGVHCGPWASGSFLLAHLSGRLGSQGELIVYQWSVFRPSSFHTFKLEYLWGQLANLYQILYVASLGCGKGCRRFLRRLDQNSSFHSNR